MDMVERGARAMCAQHRPYYVKEGWCFCDHEKGELCRTNVKHLEEGGYFALAKAAILAMREPTEAMGYAGAVYDRMSSNEDIAKGSWRAMIDVALAAQDNPPFSDLESQMAELEAAADRG